MRRWLLAATAAVTAASVPLFALQQEKPKEEPKKESRTAYIRRIFEKDRCSFADVCRIVLSLSRGEHTDATFADVRKELLARGIVPGDWETAEAAPATKGMLSYMLCKALGIKGGVTMSIFGTSERYAFRECTYRGLVSGRSPMEYVTGRELIDALAGSEAYKERGNAESVRK